MRDLFKSEIVRFRGWAAALAAAHLIGLAFLTRIVDLAQQPLLVHWVFGGMYALVAVLFGLYQVGSYRKPNQWLNLMHRPLPPAQIAAGIFGAGCVLSALVVAVPIVLVAMHQETMAERVVDLRHWLLPLSGWLIGMCAYLAGSFCALRGIRYAGAALVLLAWLIASRACGFGLLALELIALIWLAAILLPAFKPDLSTPPRSPVSIVATALPLSMAVYLLLMLAFIGIEMLWVAQGSHPTNTPTPPVGGHNEVEKLDDRGRMLAALQDSVHPDTGPLREQVERSEPQGIGLQVTKLPQRNELANVRPMEFDDTQRNVRWVFSHDDMRLHGYNLDTRRSAGVLGVGETNAPFPAVALSGNGLPGMAEGDAVLVGGNTLYQYVSETKQVLPRIQVPPGETLLGGGPVGKRLAAMSDKALYFDDGRALSESTALITPRLRVPMPGDIGDLRNLDLIETPDGHLVGFLYSAQSHTLAGAAPYQVLLRTHDEGRIETINRRALDFDYPAIYRYRLWWPSPALYALGDAALSLFEPPRPLDATDPAPIPLAIVAIALALAVLSLVSSIGLGVARRLSGSARIGWAVACATFGPPMLIVMWLMLTGSRKTDLPPALPTTA